MAPIGIITSLFLIAVLLLLLGYWILKKQKEAHQSMQAIIKDAELFQLINKTNHFITATQLAETIGANLKQVKKHLDYLTQIGVLNGFYDGNGMSIGVYQLVDSVPLEPIPKMDISQMADKEIIEVLLLYTADYQVTLAELAVIFSIDIHEAKVLLKRLLKSKQVSRLFKGMKMIYIIHPERVAPIRSAIQENSILKEELNKLRARTLPTTLPNQEERIKIPDAAVIQLAIENDGRLTPTLLCLKNNISIEDAKYKLEQLYEQGTFVMDIDESSYVMGYQLRDQSLLD